MANLTQERDEALQLLEACWEKLEELVQDVHNAERALRYCEEPVLAERLYRGVRSQLELALSTDNHWLGQNAETLGGLVAELQGSDRCDDCGETDKNEDGECENCSRPC